MEAAQISSKRQCDHRQQNTRHRQTKRKADGCRPVDQNTSSTLQKQQSGQQSGTEASRQAKEHQASIDQQKSRTADRAASRAAKQPAATSSDQQSKRNVPRETMANIKSYPHHTNPNREFVIVNREFVIVRHDQRARFF